MMKKISSVLLLVLTSTVFGQSFFDLSDQFFSRNVEDGLVKYSQVKKNADQLDRLVKLINNYSLDGVADAEKKAFYINAYNILVIKHIIDHYPTRGPLTIDGFFDQLKAGVAGEQLTLDQLEKERLYKSFPDPRLHFVLVCAARGCPPLADFAYMPDILEKQLTDRTSFVLNFQTFIRVNNTSVQISKIFEWYEKDFLKEAGSVFEYIDRFHDQNLRDKKLTFYEYDWSLNEF